jgi:hypothetical protein
VINFSIPVVEERAGMRKLFWSVFALAMVLGTTSLLPVSTSAATPGWAALPQGSPLKTIQGNVKADGDKITLVADEDGKSWAVLNPDTLKAHMGQHVEVRAHVYAGKNAIHVMSVKTLK